MILNIRHAFRCWADAVSGGDKIVFFIERAGATILLVGMQLQPRFEHAFGVIHEHATDSEALLFGVYVQAVDVRTV